MNQIPAPALFADAEPFEPDFHGPAGRGRVAVLIPCFNEEQAIGKVVRDFRRVLPGAAIHVFDNNSSDRTASVARESGAAVSAVARQGKGNVVRRMFADVDADIYLLVDGDDTYDAEAAPELIRTLVEDRLDMVNGAREEQSEAAYRPGHRLGNRVLTGLVRRIFGRQVRDMLSGYKVFSRRFVKSFPAMSRGFEIETELTVHALELRMPLAEIRTAYRERGEGSQSKLRTFRDGARILRLIARLVKDERPMLFFGLLGAALMAAGVALAAPLFVTFVETGLVPRLPTAILSTGLVLLGCLSVAGGLVLGTVTRLRQEMKCLAYLSVPPAPLGTLTTGRSAGRA